MNIKLNILNKKLDLIQWISTLEDPSIIEKIAELRKNVTKDRRNSISVKEKRSGEKGQDAESGKLNPNSEARKLCEKWL